MKILFCDLCNESVPQSELDAGRAFMRKGRVVCGKCDQLMTQRDELAAPLPGASASGAGPFGGAAGVSVAQGAPSSQATLTPLAVAAPGTDYTAAPHHHAPPHHHVHGGHGRARGAGSGVAVGLAAIALTACGLYWMLERSDKMSADVGRRLAAIENEQKGADTRAMERSTELRGELLEFQARWDTTAENERRAAEARLSAAQTKQDAAQAALAELRNAIDDLKAMVPTLQRHDQELSSAAQRFAQVETRANEFENTLGALEKRLEESSKAAAPAPAAPAAPVGAPPWMGLVQQLESANSGDRWVAVQSLGETRDPAVAEYILPRLKDVDIFVRMVTARVLGDLGSTKATGALIDALSDNDAAVREAAYLALCTVTKKNLPFEPHQDAAERAKKVKAWQDWWKKAQEEGSAQ